MLGEFPVNDVAHIAIKQGTNELNLVKKDDFWRVQERNNYPANYSEISDFLLKARDLKIVQSDKVGPSQLPRYGLITSSASNSAMTVELKDKTDKNIRSLLLGKKHMRKSDRPSPFGEMGDEGFPDGRYVKTGDSSVVAVISEAFANIEPKRKNKEIGSSLQARVVLHVQDDLAAFLEPYARDLPMLFIVSEVEVRRAGGYAPTTVIVERADGVKCERCWRYVKSVSTDPAWAGICDRCQTALAPSASRGAQPTNA